MNRDAQKQGELTVLDSVIRFSATMLWLNLRNWQSVFLNLATPIAIMGVFLFSGSTVERMKPVFPLILGFSLIFSGVSLGTRILSWREQRIFRRLAVSSTPLGHLVIGLYVSQLLVNLAQALLVILVALAMGFRFSTAEFLICLYALALAAFCFTAFGPAIAAFINRVDLLNYAYIFIMMPMSFLSFIHIQTGVSPSLEAISSVMPTTAFLNLLNVVNQPVDSLALGLNSVILLAYGLLFLFIASRRSLWLDK